MVGRWLEGGWEVVGRWLRGGWEVVGRWLGGGWKVFGRWLDGSAEALANIAAPAFYFYAFSFDDFFRFICSLFFIKKKLCKIIFFKLNFLNIFVSLLLRYHQTWQFFRWKSN